MNILASYQRRQITYSGCFLTIKPQYLAGYTISVCIHNTNTVNRKPYFYCKLARTLVFCNNHVASRDTVKIGAFT